MCLYRVYVQLVFALCPLPNHIRNSDGPEHIKTVLVCSVDVRIWYVNLITFRSMPRPKHILWSIPEMEAG